MTTLRTLGPDKWKSGIAAWLGWLFDGLDMHLYTLVAAPFVMELLGAASTKDPAVLQKSSWIMAAFLVGWACGGAIFGRAGDLIGRSRALGLTILTYALFTGLSFFAHTWWQLLIFRFLAALGIGGEWAVGSALLSETWPARLRPWVAAVLQTAVNLGVLLACLTAFLLAKFPPRCVFLVGVLPALLVLWIRSAVPEPEAWHQARERAKLDPNHVQPGIADLFRGPVRRTTILTIIVCACSLSAWWAVMFWNPQHFQNLPEVRNWSDAQKRQLVSKVFSLIIIVSIAGNFFGAAVAKLIGYRRAIALMCVGFFLAMLGSYGVPRDHTSLLKWVVWVGFFSGVFGLFTMYLPPLFPTLLRTTGAGFCYNIGRLAAAFGTVFFGLFAHLGDLRKALLYDGFLFIPAALVALMLPELSDKKILGIDGEEVVPVKMSEETPV